MNPKGGSYSRSEDLYPKQKPILDDLQEEGDEDGQSGDRASNLNQNVDEDEQRLIEKEKSKFDSLKDLELDGFSALANATSVCGVTFWFCCLIIVLAFLTYEIYKTIDGYVNQPVLTTYTITKNDTMKLPYLLVCSGNFINESKLKTMRPRDVQAALSFQVSLVMDTGKKRSTRPKRSIWGSEGEMDFDQTMFETNGVAFALTDETENWQNRLVSLVEDMGYDGTKLKNWQD
uniref:Uncharacterized protein n=1 Tax=Romanomermis culicivorax TaxID=13658 RepID=A0A915J2L1_ROMCU